MMVIRGRYNSATVLIDEIDDTTRKQIQNFCDNPSFHGAYIAIMPDCHAGAGSCIGFTMQMNERIIPDVVGVDIGCGMLSCKFDIEHLDLPAFDRFIKEHIPSGFSIHLQPASREHFFEETVRRIRLDEHRVARSVGTLGGGNHFIEAGYGQDGKLWITVHSGSRNFGLQIARHHGQVARRLCERNRADTRGMPFLEVRSPEGAAYIHDALIGVRYASLNRRTMMESIERFVGRAPVDTIESRHNFIDESGMIRKGATPAHEGHRLVIPFNMRDGIAICRGRGSPAYNCSAPHGAGRILSRTRARATLSVDTFQDEMKHAGVFTTTANRSTLDESPEAYKDKDLILRNIAETVDVLEFVKPAYNFKAGDE